MKMRMQARIALFIGGALVASGSLTNAQEYGGRSSRPNSIYSPVEPVPSSPALVSPSYVDPVGYPGSGNTFGMTPDAIPAVPGYEFDTSQGAPIRDPYYVNSYFNSAAAQQAAPSVPIVPIQPTSPEVLNRLNSLEKRLAESDAAKKKLPSVTVNGVFQADGVMFNQTDESRDQYGSIENGAGFRRARLSAKGSVTDSMNYFMQMDFGFFGRPTFTDVWVEQTKVPILGNVRVGQWKQPFSLEVVSSFRYTTFMERSLLFQTFTPFRHIGVGFYDHADDLNTTWAASYFRTGQDQFGNSLSTNGGNGVAGRLTHLLYYCGDKGEDYLHVGAGYFMNSPPRDAARFRTIPEIFVGEFAPGAVGTSGQAVPGAQNGTPFFADTGVIPNVSDIQTFGLEGLFVHGPLSLQSETMLAGVNGAGSNDFLYGSYAQVGYFLTGEHRPTIARQGPLIESCHSAALEVAEWEPGKLPVAGPTST